MSNEPVFVVGDIWLLRPEMLSDPIMQAYHNRARFIVRVTDTCITYISQDDIDSWRRYTGDRIWLKHYYLALRGSG